MSQLSQLAMVLGVGAAIAVASSGQACADTANSNPGPVATAREHKNSTGRSAEPAAQRRRVDAPAVAIGQLRAVHTLPSEPKPSGPVESPISLMALAAARRRPGQVHLQAANPVASAAVTTNPIGSLFNNKTPTLRPVQTDQSASGVVHGVLNVDDPDSSIETYTVTTDTIHGHAVVNSDGSFTYTPDPAAAHTGITDSFQVTVSDASSGFHIHGLPGLLNLLSFGLLGTAGHTSSTTVTVKVTPVRSANVAPTGVANVGAPDPTSGVVHGTVEATDGDSDTVSFSGSTTTTKGSVGVAADGSFTYTPTAAARHAAAKLNAAAGDTTDTFAITLCDGYGGVTEVPVTVDIAPANAVPVAGTPSVGIPNAASGLVAGALLGSDLDGDTLTYSGSSTTAKGTVTVNSNGAFSYTPTLSARHAAAAQSATAADKVDTFTLTITDGYGGTVTVPVSVTIAPAAQVTFNFVYGSGSQLWSADARNALSSAANALASYIVATYPVTLTYSVIGTSTPQSSTLASTYEGFVGTGAGFYDTVVQAKILTGVDPNGAADDGQITWNFAYSWATGDSVGGGQYDMKATALHELIHSLGFLTGTDNGTNPDQNWTLYDKFLVASNGTAIVGNNYVVNAANLAALTGGNGGVYFGGPNAVAAYGGLVPLYTPGSWQSGSSVSHLDPSSLGASTHVMNPYTSTGPGVRTVSGVELGILKDLGYNVSNAPISLFIFVFGLRRRRHRDR